MNKGLQDTIKDIVCTSPNYTKNKITIGKNVAEKEM